MQPDSPVDVSIVLPVFNEAGHLVTEPDTEQEKRSGPARPRTTERSTS